jgi:hypothetical protein
VKAILGVLPYGVVLAVAGGAIWWLLSREMAAGKWLLAGVIVAHGLVHLLFFAPSPAATPDGPEWPFDIAGAWPVTSAGLDVNLVRTAALALVVVLIGAFSLAGLSTAGIAVPTGWWAPTVVVGAAVSAVVLVALFSPQLVLGLGIDAVLLWVVVANAWKP